MPKPNFKMLVKIQLGEESAIFPHAAIVPRHAKRGELVLVKSRDAAKEDSWVELTAPLLDSEVEWIYMPLSAEEVCERLATRLHENNPNITGEELVEILANSHRARHCDNS